MSRTSLRKMAVVGLLTVSLIVPANMVLAASSSSSSTTSSSQAQPSQTTGGGCTHHICGGDFGMMWFLGLAGMGGMLGGCR